MTDGSDRRQPHKTDLFVLFVMGWRFTAPKGGHLRLSNVRTRLWLPAVAESANAYPDVLGCGSTT